MEVSDDFFILHFFQTFLKHQHEFYSQAMNSSKEPFSKNTEDSPDLFSSTFSSQPSTARTHFTSRKDSEFSTSPATWLTGTECEMKLKDLNTIFEMEDIDLMTMHDCLQPGFLHKVLEVIAPEEFTSKIGITYQSQFTPILFQAKNFLHARNFDPTPFLKNLRSNLETNENDEESKIQLAKVVILIAFLMKDEENDGSRPLSLIKRGFDFSSRSKNTIKPSFIKNMFLLLTPLLEQLGHFDDESVFEVSTGRTNTASFVVSNPEIVEMRKTGQLDDFMQTMESTLDQREEMDFEYDSPFKTPENDEGKALGGYSFVLNEGKEEEENEFSDMDDQTSHFLLSNRKTVSYAQHQLETQIRPSTFGRSLKLNSRKFSTPVGHRLTTPRASFSEQVLGEITDEFESREKEYLDQIETLKTSLKEIELKNEEMSEINESNQLCMQDLETQIAKLEYAEKALGHLSSQIHEKKSMNQNLVLQVHHLVEKLGESEQVIKRYVRSLKSQDEIHNQHLQFFRQSEELLKGYYEEKLRVCLAQLKIHLQVPKSDFSCQTDNSEDTLLKEQLHQSQERHEMELKKRSEVTQEYKHLYSQAVSHLETSYQQCHKIEQKVHKKKVQIYFRKQREIGFVLFVAIALFFQFLLRI